MSDTPKVQVRLTTDAQKAAKGAPLTFAAGARGFTFTGDGPLEVELREWREQLANHVSPDGAATFELVPVEQGGIL